MTDRYPVILQSLDEEQVYDNFYLDMNGIIHQCTHPDDDSIVFNDTEAFFTAIFEYTEGLFRIVGPRKLMFLAIDGVAPRAKMNQQRSRRFRSAKDAERGMLEAIERGDEIPEDAPFDSNCITPGTQFMTDLSLRFREWIDHKMATDPAWQQGCTVIFSGSEVPGEGEHKLVDYIRTWVKSDDYDPSVRHCMYGLDADLMMLGLLSRTPHFSLLREKMRFGRKGARKTPQLKGNRNDGREFDLLPIALLRDMLFLEFSREESGRFQAKQSPEKLAADLDEQRKTMYAKREGSGGAKADSGAGVEFKYSARRVVDDFVFMCMLVGNDFIPNLPHLDIAEGGLNTMFRVYKTLIRDWKGYLTDGHRLHPDRLESFLTALAESESHYFANRAFDDAVPEYKDAFSYRRAYYQIKLGFDVESETGPAALAQLRKNYLEGLHWCLQYYHLGVSSWNWFYPEFYAPLAADMVGLRSVSVAFKKGSPFSPVEQLLSVLPPHSAQFLPAPMRELMVSENSPVIDFYPDSFETDQNNKRNTWEAVVIIPFIDEERLLNEVRKIDREKEMTEQERARDVQGVDHWFKSADYPENKSRIPPMRPSKYAAGRQSVNFGGSGRGRGGGRGGRGGVGGGYRGGASSSSYRGRGRGGASSARDGGFRDGQWGAPRSGGDGPSGRGGGTRGSSRGGSFSSPSRGSWSSGGESSGGSGAGGRGSARGSSRGSPRGASGGASRGAPRGAPRGGPRGTGGGVGRDPPQTGDGGPSVRGASEWGNGFQN